MGRDDDDDDDDDDERDGRRERGGRVDVATEGDEEVGERTYRPWAWAVTSSFVIVLGVGMLLAYPAESREARRYAGADPCADGTVPPTCVEIVPAEVVRTRKEGFKRPDYYVDLRVGEDASFPPQQQPAAVEVEDTGEVYDSLGPGDRVELGYWGPNIARITKPGVGTVETIASPTFDAGVTLGLGPGLAVVGALSLRFAVRLRRRTGSWTKKGGVIRGRFSVPRAIAAGGVVGVIAGSLLIADSNTYLVSDAVAAWVVTGGAGAVLGLAVGLIVTVVRRLR